MRHVAYNKDTGEVICATRSNHLKRMVAYACSWDKKFGYPTGRWVFSHNGKPKC